MSRVVALSNRIVFFTTRGTTVNGNQTGVTSIIIHSGGLRHAPGEKIMVAGDPTKYAGVLTVSNTLINLDRTIDVSDRDRIVNLGTDTGTSAPNYDGYVGTEFVFQISEDVASYVVIGNKALTDGNGYMGIFVAAGRTFDYFVFSHEAQLDQNAGIFADQLVANDGTGGTDQIIGELTVNDVATFNGIATFLAQINGTSLELSGLLNAKGAVNLGDSVADVIDILGLATFRENVILDKDLAVTGDIVADKVTGTTELIALGTLDITGDATFRAKISQVGTDLVSFNTMEYGDEMRSGSTGAQISQGREATITAIAATARNLVLGTDAALQILHLDDGVSPYDYVITLPTPVAATDTGKRFRFQVNLENADPTFKIQFPGGTDLIAPITGAGSLEQWLIEMIVLSDNTWLRIHAYRVEA